MLAGLSRPATLAVTWPATLVGALLLGALGALFETPAYGVLHLELAFHKQLALWILEEWGPAGTRAFAWQTAVDCAWAPLYGMAIAGLAGWLWRRDGAPAPWVRPFMVAALAAAALDLVENVFMLSFAALAGASPAWVPALFALAAAAKFALLALALLPILVGLAAALSRPLLRG